MKRTSALAVVPAAKVRVLDDDRVILTEKLVDGLVRYGSLWDGPLTVLMEDSREPSSNLDEREYRWSELPFRLKVVDLSDPDLERELAQHEIVLGSLVWNHVRIAEICHARQIPSVLVAEYSLRTRWQITRSQPISRLRQVVRCLRDLRVEQSFRRAARLATGVQCNGTPTFEAYRRINGNPLLFFDTRGDEAALITEPDLEQRLASSPTRPIRLLFSGRLTGMKGADHLPRVAHELRNLGVPFEMRICGGGELEPAIRQQIAALGLGDQVQLMGVLPFQSELVPLTKQWPDLFVCCHMSGDPSCTYLEVMACGVPIVGYANEAFTGITRHSGVGWATPMGRPRPLARQIAALAQDRPALEQASRRALAFARANTFETTFEARIRHLRSCLKTEPAATTS